MKMSTDQRGMTLVEVIMAAAIAVMLTGVLGSAIFQFIQGTEEGNDQFRALHDVQNAGYWITLDGKRAETTNLIEEAEPVETTTLNWNDGSESHNVIYSLSGTNLQRNHNGTITSVARYVSSVGFEISQGVITATLTSSHEGRWGISKEMTYKICLRTTG